MFHASDSVAYRYRRPGGEEWTWNGGPWVNGPGFDQIPAPKDRTATALIAQIDRLRPLRPPTTPTRTP